MASIIISHETPTVNLLDSYILKTQPVTQNNSKLPQDKNLALIAGLLLPNSMRDSMREQTKELATTLTWIQDNISPQNQVDLYFTYS